jgi:hypothetical protein
MSNLPSIVEELNLRITPLQRVVYKTQSILHGLQNPKLNMKPAEQNTSSAEMLEACKVGNFSVAFFTKGKYINEKCG